MQMFILVNFSTVFDSADLKHYLPLTSGMLCFFDLSLSLFFSLQSLFEPRLMTISGKQDLKCSLLVTLLSPCPFFLRPSKESTFSTYCLIIDEPLIGFHFLVISLFQEFFFFCFQEEPYIP